MPPKGGNKTERTKTPKLVITFSTTTAAMATDAACPTRLGRLIPIPPEISAGCGLAWCAPPECEAELLELLGRAGIEYCAKQTISLY